MGALPTTDLEGYDLLRRKVGGALSLLRETVSIEFKKAQTWEEIKRGIPKDILAMSNCRDGGIIIIGVEEGSKRWNRTGMTDEQLDTYNPDDMIDHVNKYASPSVTFNVVRHTDEAGLKYLIIQVHHFEEKPVVCRREYADQLRRGGFYIRPLGKAESREVQTAEEMHDLLDLAVEKRMRSLMHQVQRLGIDLKTMQLEKTDAEKFDEELEGL